MFLFIHLFTGSVLGFLIADLSRDRRWILPCIIGSVLPDLVDKSLAILWFGSFAYGRTFCHTLAAALVLLAIGLVLWKRNRDPAFLGIAAGVISHQVLDLMWGKPANWLYPAFGPFRPGTVTDVGSFILYNELLNPLEITLALLIAGCVLGYLYRDRLMVIISRHAAAVRGILIAAAIVMWIAAGFFIGAGLSGLPLPWTGWLWQEEYFAGGIVFLLAGYLLWRWRELPGKT